MSDQQFTFGVSTRDPGGCGGVSKVTTESNQHSGLLWVLHLYPFGRPSKIPLPPHNRSKVLIIRSWLEKELKSPLLFVAELGVDNLSPNLGSLLLHHIQPENVINNEHI